MVTLVILQDLISIVTLVRKTLDNCTMFDVKNQTSVSFCGGLTGCQSVEVIFPLHNLLFWGRDKDEMILPLTSSKQSESLLLLACLPHPHMLTHVFSFSCGMFFGAI